MDSSLALKYHFKTFRITGLWPTAPSILYTCWTVFALFVFGLLLPFSLFVNLFFVSSINELVDCLIIASSMIVVTIKAINLYTKRKGLKRLLSILKDLDDDITQISHVEQFNRTIRSAHRFFFIYFYLFISTCGFLVVQTFFDTPEERLWSSTHMYPFEWAQNYNIYIGGLIYQGITNCCIVLFAVAGDTYGVVLVHLLSKHIDILNERLQELGRNNDGKLQRIRAWHELIKCCTTYEKILECSDILNNILKTALFAQFGVSGVVLCTSAFQLTMIEPGNISKLFFIIFYFLSMLTEVFVPCYFGSVALEKSHLITRRIFESNWIEQNEKYKKAFQIFVIRSLKPLQFYAGGLFPLDLGSFLRILKTAYSLFALLKNVQ